MTGNKCILDTNVIINIFRNKNTVADRLDAVKEIYVPVEVVGELYCGAYSSSDPFKHIGQIRFFLLRCNLISPDYETASAYGEIKATLLKKGKPIPENDIWIAALSIQHKIPVFTSDKHFKEIDGIDFFS